MLPPEERQRPEVINPMCEVFPKVAACNYKRYGMGGQEDGRNAICILGLLVFLCCRQQALHLIKEMDSDGDGQISEAEVLENQETFMNSEVTDYGRELHVSHDEL